MYKLGVVKKYLIKMAWSERQKQANAKIPQCVIRSTDSSYQGKINFNTYIVQFLVFNKEKAALSF